MATSLSNLLWAHGGAIRLVVQADRRQVLDRRRAWRGGRRATDRDAVLVTDPATTVLPSPAPANGDPHSDRA